MKILRPGQMPRLWWVNPWSIARKMHQAAFAVKGYADRADQCIDVQAKLISEQAAEISKLRSRLEDLTDSITAGKAIQPDPVIHV